MRVGTQDCSEGVNGKLTLHPSFFIYSYIASAQLSKVIASLSC